MSEGRHLDMWWKAVEPALQILVQRCSDAADRLLDDITGIRVALERIADAMETEDEE